LILLSLGTHHQAFPRALDLVEPLAIIGIELLVQHGSTPARDTMPNSIWTEFMSYSEMVNAMSAADAVICHAGVGTIMTALKSGHTPIVIPREAKHDEHVDDHQQDIAARLAERGLVRRATGDIDIRLLITPRIGNNKRAVGKGSMELRNALVDAVTGPSGTWPLGQERRSSSWRRLVQ
jgi:UDP-N-acetylglucosamine transferase subunit ALG13